MQVFGFFKLEDYTPEVEGFYRKSYSGRKLQWHHLMSNGVVGCFFNLGLFPDSVFPC